MIRIVHCHSCERYHLEVNNHTLLTADDKGVCERQARIFEHCRNIPYRAAIKTLMEDIGFSEDTAKHVYLQLTEYRNTGTVQ